MVLASSPVASVIRFAALPVGAHNTTFSLCDEKRFKINLIIVVFPVPGPPVIMQTLLSFIHFKASYCLSDNFISNIFSNFSISFFILFIFLVF